MALQDLDPVPVWILYEEECRQELAAMSELLDRRDGEAKCFQSPVFGIEILDHEGEVTVAVPEGVRLGSILVDRELQLEISLWVAQVHEGKALECKPIRNP